jgi:Protein of unknown function (DUF2752).
MNAEKSQPSDASTLERGLAATGVLAMTAGAAFVWYFEPTKYGFFPQCPLFTVTGFACPGCGLTRGFHALFHGDIVTALGFNALIPLFVLLFGSLFLSLVYVVVRGKPFPRWSVSLPVIWGMFVLLIGFGIVRNIPAYPFTLLFP